MADPHAEANRLINIYESVAVVPPRRLRAYLDDLSSSPSALVTENQHWLSIARNPPGADQHNKDFMREFAKLQNDKLRSEVQRLEKTDGSHDDGLPAPAEVKARLSLMDLVSRDGIELTKNGNRYRGLCPFHDEKTPSLVIYEDQGSFYCYGCGKGGDAFDWVMQRQGLSFPEALRYLHEH